MEIDTVDGKRPSAHHHRQVRQSSHAPDKAAEILRLKRKILKDQRTRNQHFASMEIKRQKMRDVAMERRKAAKDKKVSCGRWRHVEFCAELLNKSKQLDLSLIHI